MSSTQNASYPLLTKVVYRDKPRGLDLVDKALGPARIAFGYPTIHLNLKGCPLKTAQKATPVFLRILAALLAVILLPVTLLALALKACLIKDQERGIEKLFKKKSCPPRPVPTRRSPPSMPLLKPPPPAPKPKRKIPPEMILTGPPVKMRKTLAKPTILSIDTATPEDESSPQVSPFLHLRPPSSLSISSTSSEASSPVATLITPPLSQLPIDLVVSSAFFLDTHSRIVFGRVCKAFHRISINTQTTFVARTIQEISLAATLPNLQHLIVRIPNPSHRDHTDRHGALGAYHAAMLRVLPNLTPHHTLRFFTFDDFPRRLRKEAIDLLPAATQAIYTTHEDVNNLSALAQRSPYIKVVNLVTDGSFSRSFSGGFPALESLYIPDSFGGTHLLNLARPRLRHVAFLSLSGLTPERPTEDDLVQFFRTCTDLEHIDEGFFPLFTLKVLSTIVTCCKSIKTLRLSQRLFRKEHLEALGGLSPTLTSLQMTTSLGLEVEDRLQKYIRFFKQFPSLSHFKLQFNDAMSFNIEALEILEALSQSPCRETLRSLDLGDYLLRDVDALQEKSLEILGRFPRLVHIELVISTRASLSLQRIARSCPRLTLLCLKLSSCDETTFIADWNAEGYREGFRQLGRLCPQLHHLSLDFPERCTIPVDKIEILKLVPSLQSCFFNYASEAAGLRGMFQSGFPDYILKENGIPTALFYPEPTSEEGSLWAKTIHPKKEDGKKPHPAPHPLSLDVS